MVISPARFEINVLVYKVLLNCNPVDLFRNKPEKISFFLTPKAEAKTMRLPSRLLDILYDP
jgi:hypothetical protein